MIQAKEIERESLWERARSARTNLREGRIQKSDSEGEWGERKVAIED